MSDGAQIGKAFIEVTPELSRTAMARFKKDLKSHLSSMAKEADQSLKQSQKDLMGRFQKEVDAFQKGRTKSIFEEQRKEIQASQSLERQRRSAADAQKKRFAEEIKNVEYLRKLKEKSTAAEKQQLADLTKQAKSDLDKEFKYRTMRLIGASPEHAASIATGRTIKPGEMGSQFDSLSKAARRSGMEVSKAMDMASHTLSQLSTRIGLASFQMQLLGGFATTFLTGPVAFALGGMAQWGYQFAVATDQATASLKALLPPGYNVEGLVQRLQKLAIKSPAFNADDVITYTSKLVGAGMEIGKTERLMGALSNIFATFGVTSDGARLALMGVAQVQQKGRAYSEELGQQIGEQIPIWKLLSDAMGISQAELRDMVKAGELSADEFTSALIKIGSSSKYIEGASNSVETLGGVWQQFKEEVRTNLGNAFLANKKAIIDAINGIKPVVMELVEMFVRNLPTMINWLGRFVVKIQELKDWYDKLSPTARETVNQLILIGLAAGPASIALSIFGTALSGVANVASLGLKSLSLFGGKMVPMGGVVTVAAIAFAALVTVLGMLYVKSETVRKAILQVFNVIKDMVANVFLPILDRVIGSFQSLSTSLGGFGIKTKDLTKILYVLLIPLGYAVYSMLLVIAAIKAMQFAVVILGSILYGLANTIAYLIMGFRELFELLAKIPGPQQDQFKKIAQSADESAKKLGSLIDVSKLWKGLTETNSNATDEWQNKLKAMDLTTTGLSGAFGTWNGIVDTSIQKQMTLEDAVNNARKAMQAQGSTAASLTDASDAYHQSLLGLEQSIKSNGRTLNEHSQAGQANRTALKAAAGASYEMMLQDIRSGVPMEEAIRRHKNRTKALKDEFGENEKTRAKAQTLIDTYGKVPKDVKTLLKLMGYTDIAGKMQEILAAQKVAANPKMSFSKALQAERKAWQFEKGEGLKNEGVGKKTGGIIRGPGGPTGDKIPIWASDLEYMIRASSVKKLGKPALDYINRTGELPMGQYAQGGQVSWPMNVDLSGTKFPGMLGGGPNTGGMGWVRMMQVLQGAFPGLQMISGYRPGAVTSTGNRSYHALGRAVDLPPRWDVFNWIREHYGRGTKELIFTPAGGRQLKNGMPHTFSGGTIAEDHYNHVHWAYDNGGMVPPNAPFINKTNASELMLNSAQGKALEEKIRNSGQPVYVSVYVDGVRRDAEVVFDEKAEQLIQALGGV